MKQLFKELIRESQVFELPSLVRRQLDIPELPDDLKKAVAFIGMRRSGKTFLLFQVLLDLLAGGVPREQTLYLNFEDDRLAGMQVGDFQALLDAYYELHPNPNKNYVLYLFLDEIQLVEGWERFVRRLLDKENVKIYLSGSSAKMLSKEIATSLRGRCLSREVFPFSFAETLSADGIGVVSSPTFKERASLIAKSNQYMMLGGFPEVYNLKDPLHREILQSYAETVIYRDIVDRYQIRNIHALKRLLTHCLQNAATPLSVNKFYKDLKSAGHAVGKDSLYDFMGYLEDAYCVFTVPLFGLSERKRAQHPKKIFPVDPGLVSAYAMSKEHIGGPLLESTVFSHLRRQSSDICYWHSADHKEIDFVLTRQSGELSLIQVCQSLKSSATRRREIEALQLGMAALNQEEATIVTLDEEELIEVPEGKITVVPLWRFLLD